MFFARSDQSETNQYPQITFVPSQQNILVCFSMQDCVNSDNIMSLLKNSDCAFCYWCYGSLFFLTTAWTSVTVLQFSYWFKTTPMTVRYVSFI